MKTLAEELLEAIEAGPFVIELRPGEYLKSQSGKVRIKIMATKDKKDAMQFPLKQNAELHIKRFSISGKPVKV